jgi:HSP20 family protein
MNQLALRDGRQVRRPASSVFEDGDNVVVSLELPGVPKDGLEIKIEGNELQIRASPAEERSDAAYLIRERRRGSFVKQFTLDESIDRDHVDASLADGVLNIRLKIKEAAKPRRIEIG